MSFSFVYVIIEIESACEWSERMCKKVARNRNEDVYDSSLLWLNKNHKTEEEKVLCNKHQSDVYISDLTSPHF